MITLRGMLRVTRHLLVTAGMVATAPAFACGSEPAVSDNASFQRWRAWCSCKGGSPPATFNEAQRVGCRATGSSSPGLPASSTSGQAIGQALGSLILEAFKEDPNAEAQRREAAARAEAERAAQAEADRARSDRLLGEMLDTGGAGAQGDLALMMGDDAPPAAGPAGVAGAGQSGSTIVGGLPMMLGDDARPPAPGSARDKVKRSDAFNLGFNDARNCFSQSAGARCSAFPNDQFQSCLDDYRGGYDAGSKAKAVKMGEAHRAGRADAVAGKPANAVGLPEAEGTCKVEWTENYNRGWFEAKDKR